MRLDILIILIFDSTNFIFLVGQILYDYVLNVRRSVRPSCYLANLLVGCLLAFHYMLFSFILIEKYGPYLLVRLSTLIQ